MQIVIALLATTCIVGLVVFGLSVVDFSAGNRSSDVSNKKEDASINDQEQVRTSFIDNLMEYENDLEPRLQVAGIDVWNRDGLFEITELKKEMMLHFGNGEYDKAQENFQLLRGKTVAILEVAEQIYKENIEKAALFLKDDLYDEAKLHINKALMIAPQSPEALALQEKIETLPVILPLLDGAAVARIENNFPKEYGLLQQVVKIAPQREEVTPRLEELAKLIKNQTFESHISSGFSAAQKNSLKEAAYHYQEAKKVAPERSELSLLSTQISTLERSLRVQKYIKQAEQAVGRDDWQQARDNYVKAAKDVPGNKTVIEGLRQATQVLDLQDRLGQHIDNPYRLTNIGVRSDAEKVLVQAETFSGSSNTVKKQTDQLSELISRLNRLVPVTVISDNKTYIQVRGVGKVGAVSEKIIQLKPGEYTFEGSRDGFSSKLVQAFIPYDVEKFTVRIVCDEQI